MICFSTGDLPLASVRPEKVSGHRGALELEAEAASDGEASHLQDAAVRDGLHD